MKSQFEPMQQTIRKAVGRPPTVAKRFAHLEDLTRFLKKYAPQALARVEGDFYPVRKTVGLGRA
jgi:hypothetical protein